MIKNSGNVSFVTSVAFECNIILGPTCCSIGSIKDKLSKIKKSVTTNFRYSRILYVVAKDITMAEIVNVAFCEKLNPFAKNEINIPSIKARKGSNKKLIFYEYITIIYSLSITI